MNIFTRIFTAACCIVLMSLGASFAQDTMRIDGGIANIGLLETTINGDTLAGGVRKNPNRVYLLSKDSIYYQESRIQFGGDNVSDTTSTLILVGEEGGNKPVILMIPKAGGDAFVNVVHGSLTLKNLFLPIRTVTNKYAAFYRLFRANQTLQVEDCVTEFGGGDMFQLDAVSGKANIIFKNTYFRDANWFGNSWNTALFARGTNGEAIDTLWVENCTATNPGLAFFGKLNPINFMFFNHNTIINVAKYPFFFHQYNEAYFTNNMFINCNWEGECQSTKETQHPDGEYMGVTNLDTIDAQLWQLGHGFVPAMEDVKWFTSNNLHFTSPYLDKYYNGDYNTVGNYPLSSRTWSVHVTQADIPIQVENVPSMFLNDVTKGLIAQYPGIKENRNFDNTLDPGLKTKGIASQAVGDEFAKWGRNNYGVADPNETYDHLMIAFGDFDPTTVPGIEDENGRGFRDVNDLIEDFSYTDNVRSTIDSRPLGSLAWWPGELATYNSATALADVKDFYDNPTAIEDFQNEFKLQNYPNPFNTSTVIDFTLKSSSEVKLVVFDAFGRTIEVLAEQKMSTGNHQIEWNASEHAAGVYYYSISINEFSATKKLVLQK